MNVHTVPAYAVNKILNKLSNIERKILSRKKNFTENKSSLYFFFLFYSY
jgi:hypothetical protein